MCTPISCVTSVHLNVTTASIRDPPYACHGEQLTFTCEVVNAASLQWAFEPDVPCDMPISYTTGDDEGELRQVSIHFRFSQVNTLNSISKSTPILSIPNLLDYTTSYHQHSHKP